MSRKIAYSKILVALVIAAVAISAGTVVYAFHWKNSHQQTTLNTNLNSNNEFVQPFVSHECECHGKPHVPPIEKHRHPVLCIRIVKFNGTVVKVNPLNKVIVVETTFKNKTINVTLKFMPVYVNVENGAMTYSGWIITHIKKGSEITVIALAHKSPYGAVGLLIGLKSSAGTYASPNHYVRIAAVLTGHR